MMRRNSLPSPKHSKSSTIDHFVETCHPEPIFFSASRCHTQGSTSTFRDAACARFKDPCSHRLHGVSCNMHSAFPLFLRPGNAASWLDRQHQHGTYRSSSQALVRPLLHSEDNTRSPDNEWLFCVYRTNGKNLTSGGHRICHTCTEKAAAKQDRGAQPQDFWVCLLCSEVWTVNAVIALLQMLQDWHALLV